MSDGRKIGNFWGNLQNFLNSISLNVLPIFQLLVCVLPDYLFSISLYSIVSIALTETLRTPDNQRISIKGSLLQSQIKIPYLR
jgi:hypothetical protein